MQISIKLGPSSLADTNDTDQVSAPFKSHLAAFGCRADGPPSLHDYLLLVDACCDALTLVLHELKARNYRAWLLMIGANLTLERRSRTPTYMLSGPARERDLLDGQNAEQDFLGDGKIRAAGLYQVPLERFVEQCRFLTQKSWTIGILSNRLDFLVMPDLAAIYNAAGWNEDGSPHSKTNFLQLGTLIGPLGDVIVKTTGAFDDRWRSVNLVYDPSHPISAVFAAAHERSGTITI